MKPRMRLLIRVFLLALMVSTSLSSRSQSSPQPPELLDYAAATWQTFVNLTAATGTGLPADNYSRDDGYARYTSPTNIGMYLWSVLAARDLTLISPAQAQARIAKTLESLQKLERYEGQFYNWYDPVTLAKLTKWPTSGENIAPFLSTVDNGWLAAGLIMVANAVPALSAQATDILKDMNFGFYYDAATGLLFDGFYPHASGGDCVLKGKQQGFTCGRYDILNTEPRIASYIGMAEGDVPLTHYFALARTFPTVPDSCDWSWQEMLPDGAERTYDGVTLFEGSYRYNPDANPYETTTPAMPYLKVVPSWGGSMFEALAVPLLVPEEQWGPNSWGINHPLYVQAQLQHGLDEAQYGYWGFSPTSDPNGDYNAYGVDAIGMNPDGYYSGNSPVDPETGINMANIDYGFGACRAPQPLPDSTAYENGIVAPHAVLLALRFAPNEALKDLRRLVSDFPGVFDPEWGFWSSVNVETREVSHTVLALDQGMAMAALANALTGDNLRAYFSHGMIEETIRPLLATERFNNAR